jgi:hypothetical protein
MTSYLPGNLPAAQRNSRTQQDSFSLSVRSPPRDAPASRMAARKVPSFATNSRRNSYRGLIRNLGDPERMATNPFQPCELRDL